MVIPHWPAGHPQEARGGAKQGRNIKQNVTPEPEAGCGRRKLWCVNTCCLSKGIEGDGALWGLEARKEVLCWSWAWGLNGKKKELFSDSSGQLAANRRSSNCLAVKQTPRMEVSGQWCFPGPAAAAAIRLGEGRRVAQGRAWEPHLEKQRLEATGLKIKIKSSKLPATVLDQTYGRLLPRVWSWVLC